MEKIVGRFPRFSPDGQKVITRSDDGTTSIRDTESGKEIYKLKWDTDFFGTIIFSPDGQKIVTGRLELKDHSIGIWDADTGKELQKFEGAYGRFSPDKTKFVTASRNGTAKIWDVETGKVLQKLEEEKEGRDVHLSPDGKRIAVLRADDASTIRVWILK
jgi:WD40 repeat protein